MKYYFYLNFLLLLLMGCGSYQFSNYGFKVENDPNYHHAESHISVDVPENADLNIESLDAQSSRLLRKFEVRRKEVELLFKQTRKLGDDQGIIVGWIAKTDSVVVSVQDYLSQLNDYQRYYYKKYRSKNRARVHVIFKGLKGEQIGYILDFPRNEESRIEEFIRRNVNGGYTSFLPDLTTDETCKAEDKEGVAIAIPDVLVRNEYTLLKVFRIGDNRDELVHYTLRRPNEHPYMAFKLCPGEYRADYTTLQHEVISSQSLFARSPNK